MMTEQLLEKLNALGKAEAKEVLFQIITCITDGQELQMTSSEILSGVCDCLIESDLLVTESSS